MHLEDLRITICGENMVMYKSNKTTDIIYNKGNKMMIVYCDHRPKIHVSSWWASDHFFGPLMFKTSFPSQGIQSLG